MNLQDLVNALDQFDSTHNLDDLVLIQRPGERYSLAVLHSDGKPRQYEEIVGSTFNITFKYLDSSDSFVVTEEPEDD